MCSCHAPAPPHTIGINFKGVERQNYAFGNTRSPPGKANLSLAKRWLQLSCLVPRGADALVAKVS